MRFRGKPYSLTMSKKEILAFALCLGLCMPAQTHVSSNTSFAPETWQQEMLRLVNEIRVEGCYCGRQKMPPQKPVTWNAHLAKAAQKHAEDMAHHNFIGHKGSNGSRIGQRVTRAGYNWKSVAENVAWNVRTTEGAVISWRDSPSHCQSMMGGYSEMGAAYVGRFWVQVFARPSKY